MGESTASSAGGASGAALRDRPFEGRLDIERVEPLALDTGLSGRAFVVVERDGTRSKLRQCGSAARAARIERYVGAWPELFPELVGRDGRYLLFEYLSGHVPLTRREMLDEAEAIGRFAAHLHEAGAGFVSPLAATWMGLRFRVRFRRDLALLRQRGQIGPATARGLIAKARARHREHGLPIALELDDVHKANWMWRGPGTRLRFVDEDGIGLRPKGMALATLLKTATFSKQLRRFQVGYDEVADASWITPSYLEYLLLLDTVRRVAHKLRHGDRLEKVDAESVGLEAMGATPEVALDWRFPRDALQLRRIAARTAKGVIALAGFTDPIPEQDRTAAARAAAEPAEDEDEDEAEAQSPSSSA